MGKLHYAIGDIHGNVRVLKAAYRVIEADAARQGCTQPKIVLLGDYVDRGANTKGVIEFILMMRQRHDQIELCGNHDDWFATFLGLKEPNPKLREDIQWLINNPRPSATSYGVPFTRDEGFQDQEAWAKKLVRAMPAEHCHFLQNLPLFHRAGNILFVHAGIDPQRTWEEQKNDKWALTWNRSLEDNDPTPLMEGSNPLKSHGLFIVHGHFKGTLPQPKPGRLNIDTCAYKTNHLAIGRVDTDTGEISVIPAIAGPEIFHTLIRTLPNDIRDENIREYLGSLLAAGLESPEAEIKDSARELQAWVEVNRQPEDPEIRVEHGK